MGSKGENSYLVFFMVYVLVLQILSTPAYCSRRILEGLSEEKHFFGPITPYHSSPPTHSSSKPPACSTPGSSGGHGGGGGGGGGGGHGGGHGKPKTPSHGNEPHYKTPPTYGGGGSPPSSPPVITLPSPPAISLPSPPATTIPTPPVDNDHNFPPNHPGTCSYWTAHPDKIVAVIGYIGNVADFFGAGCLFAYGGKNPTLHDAVANKNTDGFSALLREGTTSLLNSIACKTFPLNKQEVKSLLVGSLGSVGAAAAQAEVFKSANEGLYKS